MVSEPRSAKGTTETAGPFVQKAATAVQACRSICGEPSNDDTKQVNKSFRLKGEHDELMDSNLRGSVVVCKCELYVPHRIEK